MLWLPIRRAADSAIPPMLRRLPLPRSASLRAALQRLRDSAASIADMAAAADASRASCYATPPPALVHAMITPIAA